MTRFEWRLEKLNRFIDSQLFFKRMAQSLAALGFAIAVRLIVGMYST